MFNLMYSSFLKKILEGLVSLTVELFHLIIVLSLLLCFVLLRIQSLFENAKLEFCIFWSEVKRVVFTKLMTFGESDIKMQLFTYNE